MLNHIVITTSTRTFRQDESITSKLNAISRFEKDVKKEFSRLQELLAIEEPHIKEKQRIMDDLTTIVVSYRNTVMQNSRYVSSKTNENNRGDIANNFRKLKGEITNLAKKLAPKPKVEEASEEK